MRLDAKQGRVEVADIVAEGRHPVTADVAAVLARYEQFVAASGLGKGPAKGQAESLLEVLAGSNFVDRMGYGTSAAGCEKPFDPPGKLIGGASPQIAEVLAEECDFASVHISQSWNGVRDLGALWKICFQIGTSSIASHSIKILPSKTKQWLRPMI